MIIRQTDLSQLLSLLINHFWRFLQRIDEGEFYRFDSKTLNRGVIGGKKKESLRQIIKIIKGVVWMVSSVRNQLCKWWVECQKRDLPGINDIILFEEILSKAIVDAIYWVTKQQTTTFISNTPCSVTKKYEIHS